MAGQVAPGLLRKRWPFEGWPDHSKSLWRRRARGSAPPINSGSSAALAQRSRRARAVLRIRRGLTRPPSTPPPLISCVDEARAAAQAPEARRALESAAFLGADCHGGALRLAEQAAAAAGVRARVRLEQRDVREWAPAAAKGGRAVTHVVTNPPWGLRLQARTRRSAPARHRSSPRPARKPTPRRGERGVRTTPDSPHPSRRAPTSPLGRTSWRRGSSWGASSAANAVRARLARASRHRRHQPPPPCQSVKATPHCASEVICATSPAAASRAQAARRRSC